MGKMFGNLGARLRTLFWSTRTRQIVTSLVVILLLGSIILKFVAPVPPPHVALSGEPIRSDSPRWLTNSLLMTIIVDIILLALALGTRFTMKMVPSGLQNAMEMVIEMLYGLAESVAGKNAAKFFPWAATLFLLIIVSNWSGLFPGVGSIGYYQPVAAHGETVPADESHSLRLTNQLAMAGGKLVLVSLEDVQAAPAASVLAAGVAAEEEGVKFVPLLRAPTADLNLTFALAIATMVMVQVWGVRFLGGSYFRKFFNASGPNGFMKGINAFVGILELISEVSRILSFGFRLFGNIFAGEIVLATMTFLIAFLVPVPFYLLEVFVGFVQALVFMMLTLVFFQMATIGHAEHSEHHELERHS